MLIKKNLTVNIKQKKRGIKIPLDENRCRNGDLSIFIVVEIPTLKLFTRISSDVVFF